MKRRIFKLLTRFQVIISNWVLFSVIFALLFLWPFFLNDNIRGIIFNIFLTLVLILSVFAISGSSNDKVMIHFYITLVALWLTRVSNMPLLNGILRLVVILYFITTVFRFIKLVSKRDKVDKYVIIEAINGYLLLGIAFSLLIAFSALYFPEAFNFSIPGDGSISYDPIYFSFVTMSTLGYGDKLPLETPAKATSLLIALSGQFYLVTVMAFIVGKMLTNLGNNKDKDSDD